MILEITILIILAIIIVILVRKLPQVIEEKEEIPVNTDEPIAPKKNDFEKAEVLFEEGRYPEAEELYLKAVTSDPDNPHIYNRLGVIYLDKRYYNDALESFKLSLKYGPKIAARHANVGIVYMRLGKWGLAARYFRNALKLKPREVKYQDLLKNAEDKMREKKI